MPCPDLLDERLTPEVVAREAALLGQPLLDDRLRRDTSVVQPRHPDNRIAVHPAPACQDILDSHRQRVADVQRARHVGRRQHHRERAPVRGGARLDICSLRFEQPALLPPLVPRGLNLCRQVLGGHRLCQTARQPRGRRWRR